MRYFDWLVDLIVRDNYDKNCYQKIFSLLYITPFTWSVNNDENRAKDGLLLRSSYEASTGYAPEKYGPCSVLEMMVSLACRCEDDIMHDPDEGDRTAIWFWEMMDNLRLTTQDDYQFDERFSNRVITKFLQRKYSSDGDGGPFYIPNCDQDLRKVELWYQMNYYIQDQFYE